MNPRNALLFLLGVVCLTAWWQVESRLTKARELNTKLSLEAAYLIEVRNDDSLKTESRRTFPTPVQNDFPIDTIRDFKVPVNEAGNGK